MTKLHPLVDLLDDAIIVEYLNANPDFFNRNPRLLSQLNITSTQQGTISLVQRQQRILRDKVTTLEDEITSLMSMASENQQLYQKFTNLFFELLNCNALIDINNTIYHHFVTHFGLNNVSLKLYDPQVPAKLHSHRHELDNLLIERFAQQYHYFGRLNQQEQQLLFDHSEAGSVALIALGHSGELGVLAISHQNQHHFHPEMDNLMLMQLARLMTNIIQRLLAQ